MENYVRLNVWGSRSLLLLSTFLLLMPYWLSAQVSLTPGTSITQNFNEIGTTATASLPSGWKADNLTSVRTVSSYSLARTSTMQAASTGMSGHGVYNFGSTFDLSDRAIGGLSSGTESKSVNLYVELHNNSISSVRDFTISYQVEKYRNGTNAAGFTVQLYYSRTGEPGSWISAGDDFKTSFAGADANNSGSGTTGSAPLLTISVHDKKLNYELTANAKLYLAWNYSVTSGSVTSNAQALGVDEILITANDAGAPIPTISVPVISESGPYCAGSTLTVHFTTTGTYNSGNSFSAQLSDAYGSFTNPVASASGNSSPIKLTVPPAALQGSGYKVRLIASSPATTSSETNAFTINASPAINTVSLNPGSSQTISTSGSGTAITATATGASNFQWLVSSRKDSGYVPVAGATSSTYTPLASHFGPAGTYYVISQATTICGNVTGESQPVTITISSPITVSTAEALNYGYADINNTASYPILTLTVSGNYLTESLTVAVPGSSGYRLRIGNTANFVQSVSISPGSDGIIAGTLIQVRFEPTAVQAYNSTLQISTAGSTDKIVPLSGFGSERPVVTTTAVTNVLATSALSGGLVATNAGDAPVMVRGVVYGTTSSNLTANWSAHTTTADGAGTGAFTSTLSNLLPATAYYARAYATNAAGTSYGTTFSFTTPAVELAEEPTVSSTLTAVKVSFNSIALAMTGGDGAKRIVLARAGSAVNAAPADGVTYNTASTFGAGTQIGSGNFVVYNGDGLEATVSGLAPNTVYYFAVFEYNDNNSAFAENYLSALPGRLEQNTSPAPGQLIFEENFEAQAGSLLSFSGWSVHSGAETNALQIVSPGLSYAGYGSSALGNATSLTTSGQDINKAFEPVLPNTHVYTAFLINVASATTGGDFFLHFGSTNTQFRSRVFAKSGTAPGTVQFGISGSTGTGSYYPVNYPLGASLLVVVRFDFDGTGNSTTTLYVNPQNVNKEDGQTGFSVTEVPSSGNATANISNIALRQGTASTSPRLTIDGLRVATSYEMALGNPTFTGSEQPLAPGNYHTVTVMGEGNALVLNGPATVHGTLSLTSGNILSSAENLLTIGASGKIIGGSAKSFIQGPVKIISAEQEDVLHFPIGFEKSYYPVTLQLTHKGNIPTGYTAAYLAVAPVSRTLPVSINSIQESYHYNITSDNPENLIAAYVTVPYGKDSEVHDPWNLRIAKSSGSEWLDLGGAPIDDTSSSGLITSTIPFSTFSDFVLATSDQVALQSLPVELISFSARRAGYNVELKWETAIEKHNEYFEIQRSTNGSDYITIGIVPGKGNTTVLTQYTAIDENPPRQTAYYRLKQVDFDGAYAFSSTIALDSGLKEAKLKLYPNPTSALLHFSATTEANFDQLEVSDMMGQVVLKKSMPAPTDISVGSLDVSALPNGSYILLLRSATTTARAKFVKIR